MSRLLNRTLMLVLLSALLTLPVAAQTPPAAARAQASATTGSADTTAVAAARDAIWEKEKRIYKGRAQGGLTYYLENTSARYVGWPPGTPKPSNLEALRRNAAKMGGNNQEKLEMSLTDFTLQDGTAVIYYETHRTMRPDGTPVDEHFEVIHVWVREAADWKLIGAMARLNP